ncbi:ATP-dependent DNA helicase [Enterococcus gilvus]|uniref:ATP-dependent DNA helicase n=1 Tax=Enterococcus gilvus TaxID=160453 RepID=UPI003D6AF6F7
MRRRIADDVTKKLFKIIDDIPSLGFERREAQEDMMLDIVESFKEQNNRLIEAGVGIGKSLSYLIPGILISKLTKKPLVVATSSIQLTEQLSEDIDLAGKILGLKVDKVIGKGQKNYPCIKRVTDFYSRFSGNSRKKELNTILDSIVIGVDKQNPSTLDIGKWDRINVDGCIYNSCKYKSDCYFYQIRNNLKDGIRQTNYFSESTPKVIIVNQDLLISHLFKLKRNGKGIIYSDPCLLIIDEIHNIEEKTRNALTKEVSKQFLNSCIKDYQKFIGQTSESEEAIKDGEKFSDAASNVFQKITKNLISEIEKKDYEGNFDRLFISKGDKEQCSILIDYLNKCMENADIAVTMKSNDRLDNLYEDLIEKFRILKEFFISYGDLSVDNLLWGSMDYKKRCAVVSYCPKEIDQVLKDIIFYERYPTIGLSATITVRSQGKDSYEYISKNIGFIGEADEVRQSPFRYYNSRIFIPKELPNYLVRDQKYYASIANLLKRSIENNSGGNLVLFTAKEDLKCVGELLRRKVSCPIYEDGGGLSQKEILEKFRKTGGVILGTGVFWEGIDLKGKLLTNVVIVRLPFPVPDPIIDYKIKTLNNDSDKVLIPEMITKLKQGSGRLIRSMEDTGTLTILDSRMNVSSYKHKQLILDSLPIKKVITGFDKLKQFQKNI